MDTLEVVCAVVKNQDTYLIARRARGIGEGVWEFPGGKVEAGESGEQAAIREFYEELQVCISIDRFLCDIVDSSFSPMVHVRAYLAHMESGEINLLAHTEYQWVKAEDLNKYSFQEADHDIIAMLQTM